VDDCVVSQCCRQQCTLDPDSLDARSAVWRWNCPCQTGHFAKRIATYLWHLCWPFTLEPSHRRRYGRRSAIESVRGEFFLISALPNTALHTNQLANRLRCTRPITGLTWAQTIPCLAMALIFSPNATHIRRAMTHENRTSALVFKSPLQVNARANGA
jgi:hypothetical protein